MRPKILIFEDEINIAETLIYALETEGFHPTRVSNGQDGLILLEKESFSLIILDIGLPDQSGFEICKKIRTTCQTPIFFLTARNNEIDKIVGLEIGADDYITKPFSPREVTARVKSLFRRLQISSSSKTINTIQGLFNIDLEKFQITFKLVPLNLTKYEFGLLKTLLKRPGQVYSREQLMQSVWQSPEMSLDRTIDTHIKTLRMKLREIDENSDLIVTHRGFGYSIKELPS